MIDDVSPSSGMISSPSPQRGPDLGLVSRRKRAGTRVESASPTTSYGQSLASVEDLIQFGTAHRASRAQDRERRADRALARELGCVLGRRWLHISSLRIGPEAGALPISWTETYIDEAYSGLRKAIRAKPDTLISSLIEEKYGRRSCGDSSGRRRNHGARGFGSRIESRTWHACLEGRAALYRHGERGL